MIIAEKVTVKVTESEKGILYLLEGNPFYTYIMLSEKTGMSRETVAARIKALKATDIIRRKGSDKRATGKS